MSLGGGKKSKKLFEQAKKVTPGGVHSPVRAFRAVGGTPGVHGLGQGGISQGCGWQELCGLRGKLGTGHPWARLPGGHPRGSESGGEGG